jgi:hypothetical protein
MSKISQKQIDDIVFEIEQDMIIDKVFPKPILRFNKIDEVIPIEKKEGDSISIDSFDIDEFDLLEEEKRLKKLKKNKCHKCNKITKKIVIYL